MTSSVASVLSNLMVHVASGDALDVRRFEVDEQISALFAIRLIVMSCNENIDFDDVVGRPASFTTLNRMGERTWTGIASQLQQIGVVDGPEGLSTYHLTIVPDFWLATQRKNHRMFQQMAEPDIVKKMLGEWGIEPEVHLTGTYKKRKYRVQYGESDFAFMSRLLEDAGISFFFRDVGGKSKLVLTDAPQSAQARAPIGFRDQPTDADREHITSVRVGQRVRPGKYTLRDHDPRLPPGYKLAKSATQMNVPVEERLERYQYVPGAFLFGTDKGESTPVADDRGKTRTDEQEGEIVAKKRLEAKRASAKICSFDTSAHDLSPGMVVTFVDHPRTDLSPGKRWLVVSSRMAGTPADVWTHTCEARVADAPFRPPLVTPKPKVSGVESATVVGPPGEEIHSDEFGRVRVHFHWDRESSMDHKSSCWIHVSQPWSGAGFGGTNLPRVGQEVLVDFLGGDPDRPVIVGRLYTNLQKTPYKLPENKTQSGWQSRSSPGGGADNYNEIMFEDKKGQELLRVQAEKDHHKLVKHDEQATVGHDRTRMVGNDESVTVGNSRSKSVALNETSFVGISQTETTGIARTESVGVVSTETVGVAKTLTIGAAYTETVGSTMTTTVGQTQNETVGHFKNVTVGDKITIVCGASTITMDKAGTIVVSGKDIHVKADGVVEVDAKGVVNVKSASTVNVKGPTIAMN
jgi:type VI secretion system secreted protein VgrG